MALPINVPRINNNDDEVKLISLEVAKGDKLTRGQVVGQVETDKAVLDVEAPADGFVLAILGQVDEKVTVGSVLLWLGDSPDEAVPVAQEERSRAQTAGGAQPTAKARLLLKKHGLDAADVPASGERLTEADVERFLATQGRRTAPAAAVGLAQESRPDVPGTPVELKSEEKGMLATVTWHRDVAVAGYIELPYDPQPWDAYAKAFGEQHKLLFSPLLPLMVWRLVELCQASPRLNATISDGKRFEYSQVNPGFTVQVGETLYLTVVQNAAALGEKTFVDAMVDLQRRAAGHKLGAQETQGATIGFSSMARWKVSRHIPILPPHTALMVAHAVGPDGQAVLGATYDHRVLNGFDVVTTLRKLSKP
jgi:pyruvate/2-oxoglutarate dehydrogenase complex dihydrolipoamide acyltransferase (E2) component